MDTAENVFMDEALKATAEKYHKLMEQRRKAVRAWNKKNVDRVNEYSRKYQAKKYAEKKLSKTKIAHYNDHESYKQYQAEYRATSKLRKLPFFDSDIEYMK